MKQAVVLGASMGGLLAARALADVVPNVLVVERDDLNADARPRRGVPQAQHVHALLARGVQVLEGLFPGLVDDLLAAGVPSARMLREARFVFSGHELARGDLGVSNIQPTRAVLEQAVRDRVADLPNVKIMDGREVTGLLTDGGRVTGARVVRPAGGPGEDRLEADLVVDASGRGGRTKAWLAQLGYDRPAEDRIACDVTYVSRFLKIPEGTLSDRIVIVGPAPGRGRAMALAAHEAGRWMLTVGGMAGERPPSDDRDLLAYIKTIAPPDVFLAIESAQPLTTSVRHRFPASIRRRYERLSDFPPGLLTFGDAICSFNPVYGQGMTVAALQAEALQKCLREHREADHAELARRFFRAVAKVVDPPWQLAAGGDLAVPHVLGPRPLRVRLLNRYISRLHRAASRDPELAVAFVQVTGLIEPLESLLKPDVVARVLLHGRHSMT